MSGDPGLSDPAVGERALRGAIFASWQLWALLAAAFAALTAVLAKQGVTGISPDLATLLRTLVDPARLSSAMGFWGTFMPTGTAAALLLGPPLMAHAGWATWWTTLGGLALLMAGVFAWGVPRGASRAFQLDSRRLIAVWRTPQVWRVALAFGCYSGQWLVVIGFLPTLLQSGGTTAGAAGTLAAIASAANIAGGTSVISCAVAAEATISAPTTNSFP